MTGCLAAVLEGQEVAGEGDPAEVAGEGDPAVHCIALIHMSKASPWRESAAEVRSELRAYNAARRRVRCCSAGSSFY